MSVKKEKIEKCSEGGEGILHTPDKYYNGDLISLDTSRCSNINCPIKQECKRFLQNKIDLDATREECDSNRIISCEFHQGISTMEDFDYKLNGCPMFLQN